MIEAAEFLKNLVFGKEYLKATIKEGVAALKPYVKDLEVVHIRIDHPDLSTWRKKKYFHILRQVVCSRLDEWIFEHLVDQNEYAAFLERYRPVKARGEIGDIDEHIMDIHYRPQAIEILRRKKSFDLESWAKKRVCLEYHRRSNLYWKSGEEFDFDYRNPIQSLFIRKNNGEREVIGVGGVGSSGQREINTFFTAVFYILGKKTRIPHFLLKYNGFNEFEYVGWRNRPVLTAGFGSNFNLDKRLEIEIRKKGFNWNTR
ncbi:MAG: hypothetical protein Q8O30_04660 [Candidatus Omnitrophota bacterium]|nr:hypothetical protein [Candidatus Omnitrophota bacterium]